MPGEPKNPKHPGRRPLFKRYPERLAIFLDCIAATMPYELACHQARFGVSTFYLWKQWGEEGYQPYADFLEELRAREAEAVYLMHQDLKAAGVSGNIQAIMFLLKARYPQHYTETTRQEHTGAGGGPMRVEGNMTIEGAGTGVILSILEKVGAFEPDGEDESGDSEADDLHPT
jgi:hypothetical protein